MQESKQYLQTNHAAPNMSDSSNGNSAAANASFPPKYDTDNRDYQSDDHEEFEYHYDISAGDDDNNCSDDDDDSCIDEDQLSDHHSSSEESGRRREKEHITAQLSGAETKRVRYSRIVFRLTLFFAATGMALAVYYVSWNQDKSSFETRFKDFAKQIIDVSQINARDIFNVFEGMSLQITVSTLADDAEWPMVTIPLFEAQSDEAVKATGAFSMGITPLVSDANKAEYEEYQNNNQAWIQENLDYAGLNRTAAPIIPKIWKIDKGSLVFPEGQGYYAPTAMVSPIETLERVVNYDSFENVLFAEVFKEVIRTHTAVLSKINQESDMSKVEGPEDWPTSYMAAPIFDKLSGDDRVVVGAITSTMPWRSYFLDLVPEGIDSIYLVVQSSCDSSFTFRIDGPQVEYLGPGRHHDRSYDHLEESAAFTSFRGIQGCEFSFSLYPSDDFRSTYLTRKPLVNTIVVIAIFILTGVAFIIYDCLVERRQRKILDSATRSQAIVTSLFPANVRDRVMNNATNDTGTGGSGGNPRDKDKRDGKAKNDPGAWHTSQNPSQGLRDYHSDDVHEISRTRPIADLFPSATVLFADIVGFVGWSCHREPAAIFTLLEQIYNAFDKIANRLGIFKVETIGDCYVAACGLPETRHDHAVAMFRFARSCLYKANTMFHDLAVQLGPDTTDMAMRFGLHCGPVTAGVLRGQKSRFQLFGDTMNTAARIETSGAANRIHLSESFASELRRHGKGHWFEAREDKVIAKGKGEITTFWGIVRSDASTISDPSRQHIPTAVKTSLSFQSGLDAGSEPTK